MEKTGCCITPLMWMKVMEKRSLLHDVNVLSESYKRLEG